jgi:iron complex transport system substrate-binding protein
LREEGRGKREEWRRLRPLALLGLLWLAGCRGPAAGDALEAGVARGEVAATDDAGREVRLARPARRVVSLLPAGTETLFALGAGAQVVGRTRYDTDPELAHLPSVGGGLDPSLEALVALRPDLVVAWESAGTASVRPRLEALGIPVFAIQTRDTAAILRNIRNLGHLTGRDAAADSLAGAVRARFDSVRATVPPGPRPSVLYVVSFDPPIVAGTDNFIAELISLAGGEPVRISGAARGVSPQVSLEELLRRQPDLVIVPVGVERGGTVRRLRTQPGWRELRAVREGRVATVPSDVMSRPGPSILESARLMRGAIAAARGEP